MIQALSRPFRQLINRYAIALGLGMALLVVLASTSTAWGQEGPALGWHNQIGTPEFDEVLGVSALPSGVIVVGAPSGALPFNNNSGGGSDAFVASYGPDGEVIWAHQFGTSGTDRASSVAVDSSAVYIAGSTTGAFAGQTNSGDNLDAFVSKADHRGFGLWTRQFGTLGSDRARSIAVDSSGVYVAGVVGESSAGYSTQSGSDAFVRKYDFDGNLVWSQEFGSTGEEDAFGIALHPSGVYVAGTTTDAFPGQEHQGGSTDVFVRKYDFEGAEIWTRQSGTLGADQVSGIAAGPSGVYVAGATTGTFTGVSNFGGARDAFLMGYDFEGNELWIRQLGTEGSDEATGVFAAGTTVLVTGSTSHAFPGYSNAGDNLDAFLITYSDQGIRTWTTQLGTPRVDTPLGVAAHRDRAYIAGNISGEFPSQKDGFIASWTITGLEVPEVTPPAPAPTLAPTATPPPMATPAPPPTPTPLPTATPTIEPTATPSPTASPTPVATATPQPATTPTPTAEPALPTSTTPFPTPIPVVFPPPEDNSPPVSVQIIILSILGVLAVIALIGVVRNW